MKDSIERAKREVATQKLSQNMLDSAIFRFDMDPRLVPQIGGGKDRNTTKASKKEEDSTSYNGGYSLEETKQSEAST